VPYRIATRRRSFAQWLAFSSQTFSPLPVNSRC